MPDWRNPADYAYTAGLTAPQWAWEFLRRNTDYRQQWAAFHATWQALEADYGAPPNRDFQRWKEDPRAYVLASEEDGAGCRVDQDKVLIECALGARWGFYKFPPDPAQTAVELGDGLTWRDEQEPSSDMADADHPAIISMTFDLRLPLKAQLEQARRELAMSQRRLVREGIIERSTVANLRDRWLLYLRCLDADGDAGVIVHLFGGDTAAHGQCLAAARQLRDGGYRTLIALPEK